MGTQDTGRRQTKPPKNTTYHGKLKRSVTQTNQKPGVCFVVISIYIFKKRGKIQALRHFIYFKKVHHYPGANLSIPDNLQRTPL
jgi:hypothetical protein